MILSKLVSSLMNNESPSGLVMSSIVAYILYAMKGFRKDVKELRDDVKIIKAHLIGAKSNVIELPSNEKLNK